MKSFLKRRSKILLIAVIFSILLFIFLIPNLTNYSNNAATIINGDINQLKQNADILDNFTMMLGINSVYIEHFNYLSTILLMIISLFNLVGYLYNKTEFIFLSLGLSIVQFFSSIYIWDIGGQILLGVLFILTLIGYIFQCKKNLILSK